MSALSVKLTLILPGVFLILVVLYAIGKKSVHQEIIIPAAPDIVWQVLTATDRYPEWNPVMVAVTGKLLPGERMQYTFRQSHEKEYEIPAIVKAVEPEKLLNQAGGTRGILTFDHRYELERCETGTKLIIHEEYRGIAVPFWNPASVAAAYQRLGEALRARSIAMMDDVKKDAVADSDDVSFTSEDKVDVSDRGSTK